MQGLPRSSGSSSAAAASWATLLRQVRARRPNAQQQLGSQGEGVRKPVDSSRLQASAPAASACNAELEGANTVAGLAAVAPSTLKKLYPAAASCSAWRSSGRRLATLYIVGVQRVLLLPPLLLPLLPLPLLLLPLPPLPPPLLLLLLLPPLPLLFLLPPLPEPELPEPPELLLPAAAKWRACQGGRRSAAEAASARAPAAWLACRQGSRGRRRLPQRLQRAARPVGRRGGAGGRRPGSKLHGCGGRVSPPRCKHAPVGPPGGRGRRSKPTGRAGAAARAAGGATTFGSARSPAQSAQHVLSICGRGTTNAGVRWRPARRGAPVLPAATKHLEIRQLCGSWGGAPPPAHVLSGLLANWEDGGPIKAVRRPARRLRRRAGSCPDSSCLQTAMPDALCA